MNLLFSVRQPARQDAYKKPPSLSELLGGKPGPKLTWAEIPTHSTPAGECLFQPHLWDAAGAARGCWYAHCQGSSCSGISKAFKSHSCQFGWPEFTGGFVLNCYF